jgi:hypothetical protein
MESAAPDVHAEPNDRQRKCNAGALSTPFHAKKSIEPAVLTAEPGGEETQNNMGSQDPKAERRRGKLSLDNGLHDIVVAFAL